MTGYRIYGVDEQGRFVGVHETFAASDAEALSQAQKLLDGLDFEIWRGNQKIGYLRGDRVHFEPRKA